MYGCAENGCMLSRVVSGICMCLALAELGFTGHVITYLRMDFSKTSACDFSE